MEFPPVGEAEPSAGAERLEFRKVLPCLWGMIGWIAPRVSSELILPSGPPFDSTVIAETARIHERAGFDRVPIGYFSDAPDGFLVGAPPLARVHPKIYLAADGVPLGRDRDRLVDDVQVAPALGEAALAHGPVDLKKGQVSG